MSSGFRCAGSTGAQTLHGIPKGIGCAVQGVGVRDAGCGHRNRVQDLGLLVKGRESRVCRVEGLGLGEDTLVANEAGAAEKTIFELLRCNRLDLACREVV